MTDTQLDPELELEAQQLANYEDELRELAEEVQARDEDFMAHAEEIEEGQKKVTEMLAEEVEEFERCNREGTPLKKYSIEYFKLYELNPDKDVDIDSVKSFRYGGVDKDLWIKITYFTDDSWSLFIEIDKGDGFAYTIRRHNFKDYQDAIDSLNSIAGFIYDLVEGNIQ